METQNLLNAFIENYTEKLDGLAVKDLKLNFEKVTTSGQLDTEELSLLIISLGKMLDFEGLKLVGIEIARINQIPDTQINEALQIPAIMGMLNTYYKCQLRVENVFLEKEYVLKKACRKSSENMDKQALC